MAKTSKRDQINLTDKDYKGKSFKTAPGGKYSFKVSNKTTVKPGREGNLLNVVLVITSGPHKGTNVFDNIAPHVGWKVAQFLKALGIKKMSLTLQELLKLCIGKELRAVIRERKWEGKTQNDIVQYLPPAASDDEDDLDEDEDDESEDDNDESHEDDSDDEDEDEDESEDDESDDEDGDEDEDEDESEDGDEEDEGDDDADEDEDEDEEDDSDEDDGEDDDEDETPPPPRGRAKAAPKPAVTRKADPAKKSAAKPAKAVPAKPAKKVVKGKK